MDGVLVDSISSWQYIHEVFSTHNREAVNAYVKGEISDQEFIRQDVSQWKRDDQLITKKQLRSILLNLSLMTGAKECIKQLKQQNIITVIVSAGLLVLAEHIGQKLGVDHVYANDIKTDNTGRLTGKGIVNVPLMYKDKTVQRITKETLIQVDQMAAVGNSCFDIPMLLSCGLGIAFNPADDCIRKKADIIVDGKDLGRLMVSLEPYLK
jgi:phosphoserine phosphatase